MLPRRPARERLRVALFAPPWIPVPPPGYGGTELLEEAHAGEIGETMVDMDHVGRALDVIGRFYRRYSDRLWLSALSQSQLSQAPAGLRCVGVIPNPIASPHRAISAVRGAGWPLVLAGTDSDRPAGVLRRGGGATRRRCERAVRKEVGGRDRQQLFANAAAVLMPIRWPEPFGMVMVEATASGTPVIAFREGTASELVVDGESGFLVDDERQMAAAVGRLSELDPERCRASVRARYDVEAVTDAYLSAYREVINAAARQRPQSERRVPCPIPSNLR